MSRYIVDESWRRNGTVVFAGSPLKRFTFSGTALLERLESGRKVGDSDHATIDRLVEAGAIHLLADAHSYCASDVTVIIPAFITTSLEAESLKALIAALPAETTTIVVDDASPRSFGLGQRVRIIRNDSNRGPGASRNVGLREVLTPFVAFIDIDVEPPKHVFENLLGYFADDRVGLVAPRIASRAHASVLARYEQMRSPLDLGEVEARVRAGTRVAYVPSAMWLCKTEAIRAIDGFDESFHFGEDVDAVWRLDQAGWRCRYQPDVTCWHEPRATWAAMLAQRVGYGRSAASLAVKHGTVVAPVRTTPMVAVAWTIAALRSPILGAVVAVADAVRLVKRLDPTPASEVARISARTHRHAANMFAGALTRTWWPIALIAALVSRRARRVLLIAVVLPAAIEWRRQRGLVDPLRYLAIRMLDDTAYGIGVWQGVYKHHDASVLLPSITTPGDGGARYRDVP